MSKKKKEIKLNIPGVKIGDTTIYYNNLRDEKGGLWVQSSTVGKQGRHDLFTTKRKTNCVSSAVIYNDEIKTTLEFATIEDLKLIVKYMEDRIKVIKGIEDDRKKAGKPITNGPVIGHPHRDLSIILNNEPKTKRKKASKRK